jgi:anti-sigma regulatory factor (Ser/Thr protein kinase)
VPPSSLEILRLRLRCDLSAPLRVRQALEQIDAISPIRDDALLVAGELATNALRHVPDEEEWELEVVAELVPDGVRIAVSDTAEPDPEDGPRPAREVEPDRMGMRVVQAIARRWGAERFDGQRIWAVLAI